jgi:hypothetical protein
MLNYYPIQGENQIFRGAGTGLTVQKVATPEPLLGTQLTSNEQVTGLTGDFQA